MATAVPTEESLTERTQTAVAPRSAPPRRRRPEVVSRRRKRPPTERYGPYLFLLPAIAYLGVFTVYPLIRGVILSFTTTKLVNPAGGRPAGLENYEYLLGSDKFWASVATTLAYTGVTVVCAVGLGTAAALVLNTQFFGRPVIRAVAAIPWAIPTVAAALIFVWIYNNERGVLNSATQALGIGQKGWLIDPSLGLFSVTLATVWKVFPLVMLVMLAALQGVPKELKEAAWMDGASAWQTFKAVTFPHLMPTVRVMSLLMTIWSIRRFEIIFLITGGGPLDTTNTLVVNVYRTAFQDQNLGRAAAVGALGLVLSLSVTLIYFLAERRQEKRDDSR